jgi:hypothetical protein
MNIRAAKFVQDLRGLTLSEKSVAQAMAVHADFAKAEATMSMTLLAAEAGLKSRETASRVVKRLEERGIIVAVEGSHSKGGRSKTTTYAFTFAVNCDSPVTDKLETVTAPPENRDSGVTLNPETVTQNAETVTPQSHEGFKVLSLPSASPCAATAPSNLGARSAKGEAVVDDGGAFAPLGLADNESLIEVAPHVIFSLEPGGKDKTTPISRADQIIAAARQRRVERGASDNEIYREFKSVFDRLRKEFKAKWDFEPKYIVEPRAATMFAGAQKAVINPVYDAMPQGRDFAADLKTSVAHRHAAAELYRAIGREAALAQWEDFLLHGDHEITTRVSDDGENFYTVEVERTWLLNDFVVAHGVSSSTGGKP